MLSLGSLLLALIPLAAACEDHDHSGDSSGVRLEPQVPLTPPSRPLEWSDVNFLHTTDTHGWLLGHQKHSFPEPNYSADLGDFSSFVHHMKDIAEDKDVDFLLVDSGDLHDGTGLSDGYPPGGIDAHDSNEFLRRLPYDVMAIGNHELYVYNNTLDMHTSFVPHLKGRYLSSNVNITLPDGSNVPVGARYRKFRTRRGRKVTAFGVLFNFKGNAKNTTVQPVEAMVQEAWFSEAIQEEPDFFLLVGHMPVAKDSWPAVFNAIRAVHPTTPIMIFGGHTHIRDCLQLDNRSMSLESGRYMETIGFMSAKIPKRGKQGDVSFTRRYLDSNRVTYMYHTQSDKSGFDTRKGRRITQGLLELAKKFNLDFLFGTAPRDYTLSRDPFPSDGSILSVFIDEVVPVALTTNNTRASIPAVFIANSGSQRFDVFQGPFTKNDQLTVSPFNDAFLYIANVPAGVANKVTPALNGPAKARRAAEEEDEAYALGYVDKRYNDWLQEMDRHFDGVARRDAANATLGYVTKDACPGVGDDTLHAPLPFYSVPDYIASKAPNVSDTTPIDLVFVDFIEKNVLKVLNSLQTSKNYSIADVQSYSPLVANQVWGVFAQQKWH